MDIKIKSFSLEGVLGQTPSHPSDRASSSASGSHPGRRALEELIDWGLTRIGEAGRNTAAFEVFCQARDAGYSEADCEGSSATSSAASRPPGHPYTEAEGRLSLGQAFGRLSREPWVPDGAIAVPYDDISPKPASWIIEGRVPAGMPTILAGDPGAGKSQLTVH